MVECLSYVGYASNLVNLVIFCIIFRSVLMYSIRSITLYIVCILSFVWRSGVTDIAPPGISDTNLLAIRITFTVIVGIGMVYGILIMTTFCRYGGAWIKHRSKGATYWWMDQERASNQCVVNNILWPPYTSSSTILNFYRPSESIGDISS